MGRKKTITDMDEYYRERSLEYYNKNKEKIKLKARERYQLNKKEINEKRKERYRLEREKKEKTFVKRPTDSYVTSLESFLNDSLVCMARCMMDSAKCKIKKELKNENLDYDEILNQAKFIKLASLFIDVVADYDKACICFSDEDCKNYKEYLKKSAAIFREKFNKNEFKKVLENMFLKSTHRKECIDKIISLIYE